MNIEKCCGLDTEAESGLEEVVVDDCEGLMKEDDEEDLGCRVEQILLPSVRKLRCHGSTSDTEGRKYPVLAAA
jgi:hypothetical protein